MNVRLFCILGATLIFTACAAADPSGPGQSSESVLFLGQLYCQQQQYCVNFAYWGSSPPGYVELTQADGSPSDYLWVNFNGQMTFESSPLNVPPPAGLPLLGKLVENGSYQEVDQFFPAGGNRPLLLEGDSNGKMMPGSSTPEPSTFWLLGSGGLLLLGRRLLR